MCTSSILFNSLLRYSHLTKEEGLQKLTQLLDNQAALKATFCVMEAGALPGVLELLRQEELPPCCTSVALLPIKTQVKFFKSIRPDIFHDHFVKVAKATRDWHSSPWLLTCFRMATGTTNEHPITSHLECEFLAEMNARHIAVGSPLQHQPNGDA